MNKLDPFEEEIWDSDYQPSLRKESEWIPINWDLPPWFLEQWTPNNWVSGSESSSVSRILPDVRIVESSSTSESKKVRRKENQPKYKNFPVKTDSRREFIKKDKYGR